MQPTDKRANPGTIIIVIGAIALGLIVGGLIYRLQITKEVDIEAEVLPKPIQEEVVVEEPAIPEAEIPTDARLRLS